MFDCTLLTLASPHPSLILSGIEFDSVSESLLYIKLGMLGVEVNDESLSFLCWVSDCDGGSEISDGVSDGGEG